MRRAQVYFNPRTREISVVPGWPPVPQKGDHWVKPASKRSYSRTKHLERKVIEVNGWRLTYEDQSGQTRECSKDAFRKWTDDCRAVPKKLKDYKVTDGKCDACNGEKGYTSSGDCGDGPGDPRSKRREGEWISCWKCKGKGKLPTLEPKRPRGPKKKRATKKKKARR